MLRSHFILLITLKLNGLFIPSLMRESWNARVNQPSYGTTGVVAAKRNYRQKGF